MPRTALDLRNEYLQSYNGLYGTPLTTAAVEPAPAPWTPPATTPAGIPTPVSGQGAFGLVPGATTTVDPTLLYKSIYPNLSADLGTASANNASLLRGEIPNDTASRVWDRRAAMAAAGGVSGSPFTGANTARDLGLTRLDLQDRGQSNLERLLGTIYSTSVAPAVDLSQSNATLAAAPDPGAAAREQQRVFNEQQANAFAQQQTLMLQQFAQQQALLGGTGGARNTTPAPATYQHSYDGGNSWTSGRGY